MVKKKKTSKKVSEAIAVPAAVSAGEFKAKCLGFMDAVMRTGREITITKHRKPVARLVPPHTRAESPFLGRMKGTVRITGDLVAPVAPDWEPGADL